MTIHCHSHLPSRSRKSLGAIALLTAGLFACSGEAEDRAVKAASTQAGTPVAALISRVGSPTVERQIDKGRVDPCADDKRSVRALEYHVPVDSVTGPVRKLFGRPTVAAMTVVCVDKESKVLSTHPLKF